MVDMWVVDWESVEKERRTARNVRILSRAGAFDTVLRPCEVRAIRENRRSRQYFQCLKEVSRG